MRAGAIVLALMIVAACGSSQLAEPPAESMSPGAAISGLTGAASAAAPAFPLHVSANGRYLVDQQGTPFRIHGYALWSLISMIASPSDLSSLLTSLSSIGVNTLYVTVSDHDSEGLTGRTPGQGPRDAAGDYPFLKDTSGRVYAGTGYTGGFDAEGDTTGPTNITADMSTTNASYFSHLDSVLAACQSAGFLVLLFPSYLGFAGEDEGWAADMTASGANKVTTFGTFVGNRYKNQSNVIWMAYGDVDPGTLTGMDSLEVDLITAMRSAGATQLWGGHLPKSGGSPYADAVVAPYMSLNSIYAWTISSADDSPEYSLLLNASRSSPTTPAFFLDDDGYENGVDNAPNGGKTDPTTVRKRKWWSLLSGTAGVTFGNVSMSACGATHNASTSGTFAAMNTTAGLLSDGHEHFGVMAQIMNSLRWWLLLPAAVPPVGTLVTAGGGTLGGQDFVASAADPAGSLLVAYVPPAHTGSLTIGASAVHGPYTATWIDPTTGSRTTIGTGLSGSKTFSPPGTNAYGTQDWVLLLQSTATPVPPAGPRAAVLLGIGLVGLGILTIRRKRGAPTLFTSTPLHRTSP